MNEIIEPRHGHRIVSAAIKLKDGRVYCGVRHFDELMRMHLEVLPRTHLNDHEQGFVDNKYCFLSRQEAYKVALAANQVSDDKACCRGTLYSEDVW